MPEILPSTHHASGGRTGSIKPITLERITELLGFGPNMQDDPDKVVSSWSFTIDGDHCAIWDYRGSFLPPDYQYSCCGPAAALKSVFGSLYRDERKAGLGETWPRLPEAVPTLALESGMLGLTKEQQNVLQEALQDFRDALCEDIDDSEDTAAEQRDVEIIDGLLPILGKLRIVP